MDSSDYPDEPAFSELVLSEDQREMVESFGRLGAERLGISAVPLRGFLWRAAREWQKSHQSSVESLKASSPEERMRAAEEIIRIFAERAYNAFPEERHEEIRRFLEEGLAAYRQQHNRR